MKANAVDVVASITQIAEKHLVLVRRILVTQNNVFWGGILATQIVIMIFANPKELTWQVMHCLQSVHSHS